MKKTLDSSTSSWLWQFARRRAELLSLDGALRGDLLHKQSALLHSRAVCSNGFLGMERNYGSQTGAVTSRPPPSIALTVLTETLINQGTFYCDPFNDRMEDPHTYGYIMCHFRVIRSLQTFCMTKCATGQRSERLAFMGRSIFMTFSALTTGNTLRTLLPAQLSLWVLKLNKSDGTCLCLESSRWSERGKKTCWPKVTRLAATNVLIWAQPFMDHHLVILHLYCPRYTLLSRIR